MEMTATSVAGEVPVPWGSECQRETAGLGFSADDEAIGGFIAVDLSRSQHHRQAGSVHSGTNPTGLTLPMPSFTFLSIWIVSVRKAMR
jgi:hypothetical protein